MHLNCYYAYYYRIVGTELQCPHLIRLYLQNILAVILNYHFTIDDSNYLTK